MTFAENLQQLPPITHIAALQLVNATGEVVATIENKPGKSGSVTVYAALATRHGGINVVAAYEGLELFAEHTADARENPGKHPNIDRLLEVIATGQGYGVKVIHTQ